MHPVQQFGGIWALSIVGGLVDAPDHELLARALRRALMARAQTLLEGKTLPTFFSGHEVDGGPARSGSHRHLAFAFDGQRNRLLIIAPHILERREPFSSETEFLSLLTRALVDFEELRAGAAGRLALSPAIAANQDPLVGPSKDWISITPYRANRHLHRADARMAVEADLKHSILEAGLPAPEIKIDSIVAGKGLRAHARLRFAVYIEGMMLLGRSRHFGGGLFGPASA
jgi:CRISPR-associated protein Csb2